MKEKSRKKERRTNEERTLNRKKRTTEKNKPQKKENKKKGFDRPCMLLRSPPQKKMATDIIILRAGTGYNPEGK